MRYYLFLDDSRADFLLSDCLPQKIWEDTMKGLFFFGFCVSIFPLLFVPSIGDRLDRLFVGLVSLIN